MESTAVRTRYSRSNAYYRKRRTPAREKVKIGEVIAKQLVIAIFVFLILFAINSINTSITIYISDKVKWVLQQDTSINNIPNKINVFIDGIINGPLWQGELYNRNNNISNEGELESSITLGTMETVDQDTETDDSANSTASINSNASTASIGEFTLQLITPVEGKVSSPFGPRIDPVTQKSKFHYGLDIETDKGALIKAAASGEVLEVSEDKLYGKNIKIKHTDGTITVYAHCSEITQIEGSKVKQGDIIAQVGNTGYSTGTHLHFEIWKNEKALDPILYIDVPQDITNTQ